MLKCLLSCHPFLAPPSENVKRCSVWAKTAEWEILDPRGSVSSNISYWSCDAHLCATFRCAAVIHHTRPSHGRLHNTPVFLCCKLIQKAEDERKHMYVSIMKITNWVWSIHICSTHIQYHHMSSTDNLSVSIQQQPATTCFWLGNSNFPAKQSEQTWS